MWAIMGAQNLTDAQPGMDIRGMTSVWAIMDNKAMMVIWVMPDVWVTEYV